MKQTHLKAGIACALGILLGIYSCQNNSFYDMTEENMLQHGNVVARNAGLRAYSPVDSILASDEIWEFKEAGDRLAEKFDAYVATLSEEAYNEMVAHMEDDDYMAALFEKADVAKEGEAVDKALEKLYANTGYLRLSEAEQTELFEQLARSNTAIQTSPLKTRTENEAACRTKRDEAYAEADREYYQELEDCKRYTFNYENCKNKATARKNKKYKDANDEYEACLKAGK